MENKNAYPLVLKVLKILGPLRDFAIVDRMKCNDVQAWFCVVLMIYKHGFVLYSVSTSFIYIYMSRQRRYRKQI